MYQKCVKPRDFTSILIKTDKLIKNQHKVCCKIILLSFEIYCKDSKAQTNKSKDEANFSRDVINRYDQYCIKCAKSNYLVA